MREIDGRPGPALAALGDGHAADSAVEWRTDGAIIVYRERFQVRVLRRVEPGVHPEVELGRFLTDRGFGHARVFAGHLELLSRRGQSSVLATAYEYLPGVHSGWRHAIDSLGRYFDAVLARRAAVPLPPVEGLLALSGRPMPDDARQLIGPFLQDAELLGRRTAELHLVLGSGVETDLAPEPFTTLYQRELYQSMRTLTRQASALLSRQLRRLPEDARVEAQRVLDLEGEILRKFRSALSTKLQASRIRCHGDYHLGSVLYTGKDFVVHGLEGDENKALGRRRIKRSPVMDLAGMRRSFHSAAVSALYGREPGLAVRPQDRSALEPWAQYWKLWVSAAFLKGYRDAGGQTPFAPKPEEFGLLLSLFVREQAVRQLADELRFRPDWAPIALLGLPALLESI
ncbi:MAG: phosphotransferase [Elusimicrobia bacterium]|nr:phosphotransferase [Elusimicrobiota bacterium]